MLNHRRSEQNGEMVMTPSDQSSSLIHPQEMSPSWSSTSCNEWESTSSMNISQRDRRGLPFHSGFSVLFWFWFVCLFVLFKQQTLIAVSHSPLHRNSEFTYTQHFMTQKGDSSHKLNFFIGFFYLHFKYYSLSGFPVHKPPIPFPFPSSIRVFPLPNQPPFLSPHPDIPLHWGIQP